MTTSINTGTRLHPGPVDESDWHVLVLFADDNEDEIKGIWGPYTSKEIAHSALDELRQWPLDGIWDVRRLNKFVAAKSGTPADSLMKWTWQNPVASHA